MRDSEAAWERIATGADQVWCRRIRALVPGDHAPLLLIHGVPTCSFGWRLVVDQLSATRDLVVFDMVGFGLSAQPDRRYGLRLHADAVEAVAGHYGMPQVDLLTHDKGDSVGGEVLARSLEGSLGFTVGRRVLTNGSIYIDMAQLTTGQDLLMSLPDERNDLVGADGDEAYRGGVTATFAPDHAVSVSAFDVSESVRAPTPTLVQGGWAPSRRPGPSPVQAD